MNQKNTHQAPVNSGNRFNLTKKTHTMNKISTLFIAAIAATTISQVGAQTLESESVRKQGYLLDGSGGFVTAADGSCWHNGAWTKARPAEPCDPVPKPFAAVTAPPVVVKATPAPMVAPLVNAPVPTKISLSAGTLFTFDKAELRPQGKATLDDLVQKLEGATYEAIVVTGHTDRIGTPKYNQKLSEERAQTVKEYLVDKKVQASRIDAQGKGESEPVTQSNECKGAKSTKVIACLQPDRRVDIELQGAMKRVNN
jgi:OOP family OmpA-OmpF porin